MSHRTVSALFDREFRLPHGCLREGQVECEVVRSDCRITSFFDDLLAFRVILVLKIVIRSGGLRCFFEREVVIHDCCWMDGRTVLSCEVIKAVCRCRLRHDHIRCAGVAEVRFRVRGGCHCECDCVWAEDDDTSESVWAEDRSDPSPVSSSGWRHGKHCRCRPPGDRRGRGSSCDHAW